MTRWERFKRSFFGPPPEQRFNVSEYAEMLNQGYQMFGAPAMTLGKKEEEPERTFDSFAELLMLADPIVFGCIERRRSVFSEARLQWRNRERGNLFGNEELAVFEEPWPNASTGDLLSAMELDNCLAGNWFGVRRGKQILRLKPDWTTIVLGGQGWGDPNAVPIGYLYFPGGRAGVDPIPFDTDEVAHYAPSKHPMALWRGVSWLNAILNDVTADKAATAHKQSYLEGGAVPNTVVKPDPAMGPEDFQKFKEIFLDTHGGLEKYSTVFLGGGSSIEVIGENLGKGGTDLRSVQAHGENRICIAAGTPAILVGASEGLEAATYSNFASAKRQFVDGTMRPNWRSAMAALETLVPNRPGGAMLWYDEADIPYLQDDEQQRAEVMKEKALAGKALVEAGYEPESVRGYIETGDPSMLEHTGLPSVQTLPQQTLPSTNGNPPTPEPAEPQEET